MASIAKTPLILLLICLTLAGVVQGQSNKYGVKTIATVEAYNATVAQNPEKELVDLAKFIPHIVLDIRYATPNNFTGEQIYLSAHAFARRPVAEALKKIQGELNAKGLGLLIYDAYRPYSATVKFYEVYRDTTFVASPYKGSKHNRGCAVDITLIDLKTGKPLQMPTDYDAFVREARADIALANKIAQQNREMLKEIMHRHGFKVTPSEWWHYDYQGWSRFELLDIPFEKLTGR
jgi:zinc D-Ala-D-Ala dipeptidase